MARLPLELARGLHRPSLAEVRCVLLHGKDRIGPLEIHALLADSDLVPLLLETSGILDQLRVTIDLPKESAFIETA